MRGVPGVTGNLGKINSHFHETKHGQGPYHHVETVVDFSVASRPCAVSLLSYGAPLRSPSIFCIKLFFGPFSLMLHPDGFFS